MTKLEAMTNALKKLYLDIISKQLDKSVNPFFTKINKTTNNVRGNQVIGYHLNRDGSIDTMELRIKNIYATLEVPVELIKGIPSQAGALDTLLNLSIGALLRDVSFNLGRMLFRDGSGVLAKCQTIDSSKTELELDTTKNVIEGMFIDVFDNESNLLYTNAEIISIDRSKNKIELSATIANIEHADYISIHYSKNGELTGLGSIFSDKGIYGLSRENRDWLKPRRFDNMGLISINKIQSAIDAIERKSKGEINFILVSQDVKLLYLDILAQGNRPLDILTLDNSYKALSFNGIPFIFDRFVPEGTMYLLNSDDFELHQLCDWSWLEDEKGDIIRRISNRGSYTATLVKYADLMCNEPGSQGIITGITGIEESKKNDR